MGSFHNIENHDAPAENGKQTQPAVAPLVELTKFSSLDREDSISDKLLRETQVMLGGAVLGYGQAAADKIGNHLPELAIQSAAFAGLTYGMVRLASSSTPIRYAIPVISAAMGYSFIGNSIKEFPQQTNMLKDTWNETWAAPQSPEVVRAQQEKIANAVGPFLFDTSVGMLSGIIGGKIAANQIENNTLLQNMKQKYGSKMDESIFRVASEPDSKGLRTIGSSFAVEDNKLATAFHVVQDRPGETWNFLNVSERGTVKVLAGLPQKDIALMSSIDGAPAFKPLPIAKSHLDAEPGVVVGAPGKKFEVRPAFFKEGIGQSFNTFKADLGFENGGGIMRAVKGGRAWPGMSGGPAIAGSGEVVGVLSSINPIHNALGAGADSVPASNLRYLLELVKRSEQTGSMSLIEASKQSGSNANQIMREVRSGKLEAFVIPSRIDANAWEWRILKK